MNKKNWFRRPSHDSLESIPHNNSKIRVIAVKNESYHILEMFMNSFGDYRIAYSDITFSVCNLGTELSVQIYLRLEQILFVNSVILVNDSLDNGMMLQRE